VSDQDAEDAVRVMAESANERAKIVANDLITGLFPTLDMLTPEAQRFALQLLATRYAPYPVNFCGHCQTSYDTPEGASACAQACREAKARAEADSLEQTCREPQQLLPIYDPRDRTHGAEFESYDQ
jgi:hypothetical protein